MPGNIIGTSIAMAKNDGISDSVEDEGSSDLLLQKFIQDKNMMGLRGVTEFKDFKSTNVSKRLDNIESLMMALMKSEDF
ncbi:unnamed protein product [Allacma fusca]|uniref:Uncharacterized protein n=1 Tax=Allacma fusca TaxID=39272 RepID=A0A8J2NP05_9HEXA|nr:unnamed protein product [Allacma fusca]